MRVLLLFSLVAAMFAGDAVEVEPKEKAPAASTDAQREKPKQPPWPVPKGSPAKTIPAWAQGEYLLDGEGGTFVIGAKTFRTVDGKTLEYQKIETGENWCSYWLPASVGMPAVIRKIDGKVFYGWAESAKESETPKVRKWNDLTLKK